jgi:nanoRNase/pAp phosphatase (c-di-AMP/oligoRNAs hydrolase)
MEKERKRYLLVGKFDPSLLGMFSTRGELIWVSCKEEALNQTGNFTLLLMDEESFSPEFTEELSMHFPKTPIIVGSSQGLGEPPASIRYVNFARLVSQEIALEEKLAKTELRVDELRRVHESAKKMLILLHDNPDPDSIASALGLRTLLKRNKQTAIIGHLGESISRPENLAMIEIMDIDLVKLDPDALKDFDSIALVDVQPPYFRDLLPEVDTVIDHHPSVGSYTAKFVEIKAEEGATSTIITEYLRAAQIEISERLATALLYGIKTDTVSLNRDANEDDLEAFTFLYPMANLALLRKIERAEMPTNEIRCFGKALSEHWIENGLFFSYLGKVDREYLIPKMADFGIQAKGVEWSVAFGIVQGTHLVISVRNVGYVKSAGRTVRELFGAIGSAGGHRSAAKAVIPLENVSKEIGGTSDKRVISWVTDLFTKKAAVERQSEAAEKQSVGT